MIENDSGGTVNRMLSVLQSDLLTVLNEYMDVKTLDMRTSNAQGGKQLLISVGVSRFFDVGFTSEIP